jgi:hypothetical protein
MAAVSKASESGSARRGGTRKSSPKKGLEAKGLWSWDKNRLFLRKKS